MRFFEEFRDLAECRDHLCEQLELGAPGTLSNPVCGDLARMRIRLGERGVESVAYNARGCWPLFGALELICNHLKESDAVCETQWSVEEFLNRVKDVPPSKRHAFSLAYRSAVQALAEADDTLTGRASRKRVLKDSSQTVGEGRKKGYN